VRWVAILTAVVLIAVGVTVRRLPNTAANAELAVDQPIARLQEVRSVSLDGHQLPLARLREVMATRPGAQLDTPRLERDRAAMEQALADLGYLAAHVAEPSVTFDTAGAAYINFEVDKGKLFYLRSVEVTGAGKEAAVVTLMPGDDAIRDRIEHARLAFADTLARRGKPATVELSVHTDIEAAAVDVVLAIR
jgi:outer membrane protein assembly factor BamA